MAGSGSGSGSGTAKDAVEVDVKMAQRYTREAIAAFHPSAGDLSKIGEPKITTVTGGIVLKWGDEKFLLAIQEE